MFAFKVLNLKTASTKTIFILFFLCLGLTSLVIAGTGNIDRCLPPFSPPFIKLSSFFYFAISGNLFYKVYKFDHTRLFFLLFSFALSLFNVLAIFKYSLYLFSSLISLANIFILITIWRFSKEKYKIILLPVVFSVIYFSILTYFSLGVLILS